jgi:glycerate kinase
MNILIAPDKFRGSLSAEDVAEAISAGIAAVDPAIETISFPLADGGEGTARILTLHNKGKPVRITVNNPVFEPVGAEYGISGDGQTAFIEMAAASGLRLLPSEHRNCCNTSTLGTGEMVLDALNRGVSRIIMGIGGSATNDAGTGMAAALGFRFLDEDGKVLEPVGRNLIRISRIDTSHAPKIFDMVDVQVACDVDNPLYGKRGAAWVYGPQKGASEEELELLDHGLVNFARVVRNQMGIDVADVPGAGAAGGLGAGCMVFLKAKLVPGIQMVMEQAGFEEQVRKADLIITGEGMVDEQTFRGKVVDGVCSLAVKYNKPVLVVCGRSTLPDLPPDTGIKAIASLTEHFGSEKQALNNAASGITEITAEILRKTLPEIS